MQKAESISEFLSERIEAGDFPSAVYLIGEEDEIKFADAPGLAVETDEIEIPARLETIYDLASLTKPLVTGLLCAKLFDEGGLTLETPVSQILPAFQFSGKENITVGNLLAHTSGFPAWQAFYLLTDEPGEVLSVIAGYPLESPPNSQVRYSDFNFITLGSMLEKLHSKRLNEIFRQEIAEPLGLKETFFNPPDDLKNRIAACEFGNEYEKQVCREMGLNVEKFDWRDYQIWGEVHDGNSYFLGGVSGHAGLFATAEEVFEIAAQFLPDSTTLLKPETCGLFRRNLTQGLNEARSFAFELAETENSTASKALARDSFGHLGFTGTSLWIEPETERIFILLTNRTHRPLPFVNINPARRKFHELASELLNSN